MSTIDEIMGAVGRHGDDCIRDADAASASFEALRELIAAALADARRDVDRMERSLKFILTWADAYPLDSFPEPHRFEWQQAASLLSENGISIGSLSASNMRHVIAGVKRAVDHGLTGNDPGAIGPQGASA